MRLTAAVTREGTWYVAQCLEVDVASQGETVEEALANLQEAIALHFEDVRLTMPRNRTPSAQPAVDAIKQLEASPEGLGDFARGILEGLADALDFAAGQVEGARVHGLLAPLASDDHSQESTIDTQVRGTAMHISFEIITPEFASNLLAEHNPHNRRLDIGHVTFLAKTMLSGEFSHDNGDALRFDENGDLLDGQHRLAAIVKTGQPREMMVARGIARDTFATIDIGKRRNVADVVSIDLTAAGGHAPRGAASAATMLYSYERRFEQGAAVGGGQRRNAPPVSAIRAICMRNGFSDAVERATRIARAVNSMIAPATVALIACEMNSKAASDAYFHRLKTMEGMNHGAPEHTVIKSFTLWKTSGTTVQRSAYGHLYALLRGYLASRDGESLEFIRMPKDTSGFIYLPTK